MMIDRHTLAEWKRNEEKLRWELTFTGVCPRCKNGRRNRVVDYLSGEIEFYPCEFCLSEEQIEEMLSS